MEQQVVKVSMMVYSMFKVVCRIMRLVRGDKGGLVYCVKELRWIGCRNK